MSGKHHKSDQRNTGGGTLGIDFGTSNSAVAWREAGGAVSQPLRLEGEATTLPTAIFFNAEEQRTHFGRDAVAQYLAGTDGRLMRSLKSLLGSPLLLEQTEINGRAVSFLDIIAIFLAELATRAERQTGRIASRVVMGRPVHFVDDDPARDALAEQALREAARTAGLGEVSFELEPIAAAFDYEQRIEAERLVLVVDIGGGTSDFTLVRLSPQRRAAHRDRSGDILATRGVHIGGTDFDHRLNVEEVMPLLGLRHLGPEGREVPSAVFLDLATWHLIHWRYSARALREARALHTNYADPRLHRRLMTVLEDRLGHHIANDVELAKIHSSRSAGAARIELGYVERGLVAGFDGAALARHLRPLLQRVVQCARECVQQAGVRVQDVDALYLTGGSSALAPFQQALREAFAGTPVIEGDLFGGVAAGLVWRGD